MGTIRAGKLFVLFVLCCGIFLFPAPGGSLPSTELSYGAAANDLAQKLSAAFPKLAGYVLSAEEGILYIDLGEKDRLYPGMELHLYREGQPFSHPVTGEVLGRFETPLGTIRVLEVRDRFSIATQIAKVEGLPVTKGDRVRMTGARIPLALPTVEIPDAKGEEAKNLTRELALALTRTERFEVWDERRLLSALQAEGVSDPVSFTDPRVLEIMAKKLNVSVIGMGKLSGLFFDLQLLSTSTRSLLTIASAEIRPLAGRPSVEVARPPVPEREPAKEALPVGREIGTETGKPIGPLDESISASTPTPGTGAWKGPRFDRAMRALVVADVNGDRKPELVVAEKQLLLIYSIDPTGYRLLYTMPKDQGINILSLDAADINGNGTWEIFATSCALGRLNSFVLEYQNGKFVKVWENARLFFRCLPTGPAGGYQLFGQELAAFPDRLWGKAYQYVWSGSAYRQGPSLDLPSPANLHGLALMDLDGDEKKETLFLTESNHLAVYGPNGKRTHKTSEKYGGTDLSFEVAPGALPPSDPTSPFNQPESQKPQMISLQPRLFPVPGKTQLYVCKNIESAFSVLKKVRFFERSKIFRLAWNGETLEAVWESREFPQYMADYYQGDFDGDGIPEVAILLVEESLLTPDKSSIWIYKL